MKTIVIGGAGYIGSHIVLDLLDHGHQVTVFDNLSTGSLQNIPHNAKFIHGDIRNADDVSGALSNSDFRVVFHFAALKAAGESMDHPQSYASHNIHGSINILNGMVDNRIDKIVFSSSAAVYGFPRYLPIDEKHPTSPINFYGFTKLEIENLLSWYSRLKGLKYAALRYFNAAGFHPDGRLTTIEKQTANLLPIVMEAAIGKRKQVAIFGDDYSTPDGTCIRDYIHVNDLSSAHLLAMEYLFSNEENLVLNLGTGRGYSVKEAVDLTKEITGRSFKTITVDRRPGDPDELIAGSEKAKEILGWQPKHSDLHDIITSMWRVYSLDETN